MTSDDNKAVIDRLYLKAYERMVKAKGRIEIDINTKKFVETQKRLEEAAVWEKANHKPERPESFGTWS